MRYIVCVLALFVSILGWSQELDFVFKGQIENTDLGKTEAGVSVSVIQNGSTLFSTSSASNGKYSLRGAINFSTPFEVTFSKNGLVSKKVSFDLSKMNIEDAPPGDFRPVEELDMTMFKERENVDFSFLQTQSVASFDWNTRDLSVRLDAVESTKIRNKILELLADADKNKAEAEQKYQAAIQAADGFYNGQKYEEALDKYEEALGYKPKEKYPADQIVELDALIQAKKKEELTKSQADSEYNNLIAAADNLRDQNNLEGAISKYKEAITKKDEQYPKDQITILTKKIADLKKEQENQVNYDAAIKAADGFLKQNSLKAARDKYEEATKLKPSEQYPKDKLAEIAKKLDAESAKEEIHKKYEAAITDADAFFNGEKYEDAKKKYEEALSYEASSSYAKGRVTLCDEKLLAEKAEKERQEKIKTLLAQGNEKMSKSEWEQAKTSFNAVLALDTEQAEAKEKLAIIEQKIKEANDQALQEAAYKKLIAEGDKEDLAGKFEPALAKYEEAKLIKSSSEVDEKIVAIKKKLAEKDAVAQKEAEYASHISEGESMLGIIGDLDGARVEFEKASALFPDREAPKKKIAEIDGLLAAQKANQEKKVAYETAVKDADHLFNEAKWEEARAKYRAALAIDNSQSYPNEKLKEIDAKVAEQSAEAKKKSDYEAAVKSADNLFNESKWEAAKVKYKEALTIDNSQTYPNERIAEIDGKISELTNLEKKKADYEAAIKIADNLFKQSKWEEAKGKYSEALTIDNLQTYPSDKLAEIDSKLAELASEAKKKADYEAAVKSADNLFNDEKWAEAKTKYAEALSIDNSKTYPTEQMVKIDKELANLSAEAKKKADYEVAVKSADNLFNQEKWEEAKSKYKEALAIDNSETYPNDRIAEIEKKVADQSAQAKKKAEYDAAIAAADNLFNQSKWEEAKTKYKEALAIDNGQTYPNERISAIDAKIADKNAEATKKAEIANLLSEGNRLYSDKKLEDAKSKFQLVLTNDPGNTEAGTMLNKINTELSALKNEAEKESLFTSLKEEGFALAANKAYEPAKQKLQEALTLKNDTEVLNKIKEIDLAIAELLKQNEQEARYNKLLSEAQSKESSLDYSGAIAKYKEALTVKPAEQMPKTKITELEAKLGNAAVQAQIDKEYRSVMDKGDALFGQKKYLDAIKEYNNALALKPGEQEPVDKAAEAERLEKLNSDVDEQYEKILTVAQKKIDTEEYVKAIELLERAISLKERDDRPKEMLELVKKMKEAKEVYDVLMNQGNSLATAKDYEGAKSKYQEALGVKPTETEPAEKIAEMNKLINEKSSEAQRNALYTESMSKGNVNQGTKNYQQALSHFQDALSIKPGDVPAQNKIKEVQKIIDDLANENARDFEKKIEFERLIKEANGKFDSKEYLPAKTTYEAALKIDPSSSFARLRIEECEKQARLIGNEEAEREYRKIVEAADKNFDKADYEKSKGYYERALTIKRDDPYPKKRLNEIEAILHPVIAESAELEDLGIPWANTMEEALIELQKAEEVRKSIKQIQINQKHDAIKDEASEMTTEKMNDHYDNSLAIYQVQQQVSSDANDYDDNRKSSNEILKQAQKELADGHMNDGNYEHSENLGDQNVLYLIDGAVALDYGERIEVYAENTDVLNNAKKELSDANTADARNDYTTNLGDQGELYRINSEVAVDYGEREEVYTENAALMKTYNTAMADERNVLAYADYGSNIESDQNLSAVKIKVGQDAHDDYEERALVERDVVRVQKYANDQNTELYNNRYAVELNNKDLVQDVVQAVEERSAISTEMAKDNNEELVQVRNAIVDRTYEQGLTEKSTMYKVDGEIADVKERIRTDNEGFDENRRESVEVLKDGKKVLLDAELEKYNAETVKHLQDKQNIAVQVVANSDIKERENEAHGQKVAYVNAMDKKANIQTQEGLAGDTEERYNAKQSIENVYMGVSQNATEEIKKTEDNAEGIADINKTIKAEADAKGMGEKDKHYEAQESISNINNTPEKKVKVANVLGEEYPEGVSEESFTKNDQNGLMTAIITRRIVVIDGHADVFVRTQSLNGVTYSKNGQPTTSHVWSKETQDPGLERHY